MQISSSRQLQRALKRAGNYDVWLLDLGTLEATALTTDPATHETRPKWSPDGTRMLYSVIDEAGHFANLPGWDYYSSLHVTTDEAVRNKCIAAIREAIADAKAYGASSVLVVPAVVNKGMSYDDAWRVSRES